jgi:hypothetical protein
MKALSHFLLVFSVQQQSKSASTSFLDRIPFLAPLRTAADTTTTELRNEKLQDLLQAASEIGQVGSLASEDDQKRMEELAAAVIPFSESKTPAKFPLVGEHDLVYSAAPGASSGRVFGNVVGKVSQIFEDEDIFYNRVAFGPLQITLKAKREVKNDSIIKVSFLETTFSLFGKTIKEGKAGGGGVWKVKFVGTVEGADGKKKLVRVMETPSLFILEQPLE